MDLWQALDAMMPCKNAVYTVEFVKVKGHSGVE